MPLAEWIVSQPSVARFVQRAHAATPHRWNIGEDTVLGTVSREYVRIPTYLLTHCRYAYARTYYLSTTYPLASFLTRPSTTQGARHVGAHVALRDHGAALGLGQDPRPVLHLQGHLPAAVEPYPYPYS